MNNKQSHMNNTTCSLVARWLLGALLMLGATAAQAGDVWTYVHNDHLGSPVAETNSAGHVTYRNFTPYGETNGAAVGDEIGFTGHRNDADTGLVYMQARYYDPISGRFLSTDPVTFSANKPDHFNRYWYANGNPMILVDPTGRAGVTIGETSTAHSNIYNGPGQSGSDALRDAAPDRSVFAVRAGNVFRASWQNENQQTGAGSGLGFRISINHENGDGYDQYGHMDPESVVVEAGDDVEEGDFLGKYADPTNGSSTGPHVHHERRNGDGDIVDPGSESPVENGEMTSEFGEVDDAHPEPHQGNDWVNGD